MTENNFRFMIEVFKTNITKKKTADKVIKQLLNHFPDSKINFDLEDSDNILRVETRDNVTKFVTEQIMSLGYYCQVLE